ncbi:MAG: hypothetical protein Q9M16_02255 [Mariprofundus sp.]|nr:hypothetical protein [Mariprofundus sp.]
MNKHTRKTNPLLLSMLLIVGLFVASSAWAGGSASDDFDANADGQVTFEEVMKKLEKSARSTFDNMDRNKDGVLSNKDFDDVRQGMQKLEDWLDDLLKPFKPFMQPEKEKPETLAL